MIKASKYLMMAAVLTLAACGSSETTDSTETTTTEESSVPATPTGEANLTISGGDDMKFDNNYFEVKKGQKVTLTLKHTGVATVETMGHNWVLLKAGTDIAEFGNKAVNAQATDYIPESEAGNIIAHTKLIGGGESTSITFDAPSEPGEYPFLCSFPGHYAMMQGIFMVTE